MRQNTSFLSIYLTSNLVGEGWRMLYRDGEVGVDIVVEIVDITVRIAQTAQACDAKDIGRVAGIRLQLQVAYGGFDVFSFFGLSNRWHCLAEHLTKKESTVTVTEENLVTKYSLMSRFPLSSEQVHVLRPLAAPNIKNALKWLYLHNIHPYSALFVAPSRKGLLRT